jgi:hypothetical protein
MGKQISLLVIFSLGLLACRGEAPLSQLSDYELAERHKECIKRKPTAPGAVMACENIRRECDRRHRDLGNYICVN